MQSQKISTLSTVPTLLQGNISFSYMTMCYLKVMERLGRFSAFLCIHRTWPWKVLPVGKPQCLHRAAADSVATLHMQDSRHTENFPRTRSISNQSRSWDCSSARISACHTNSCCFSGPCALLPGCVSPAALFWLLGAFSFDGQCLIVPNTTGSSTVLPQINRSNRNRQEGTVHLLC